MFNTVQFYYFSPTGGTKACGECFCKAIANNVNAINLGLEGAAFNGDCDLAVFAMPVFAGRIPAVAAEKLSGLNGNGMKAVTLVVYGVRAYEDALLELNNIVKESSFTVVASAALVAQHSIVPAVGQGRPNEEDKASITAFAAQVMAKLTSGNEEAVSVPGNFPYREAGNMPFTPVCLPACGKCGACVAVCPTKAIVMDDEGIKTDVDTCILCMACTAACPKKARVLPASVQENMNEKMAALVSVQRENEYFL